MQVLNLKWEFDNQKMKETEPLKDILLKLVNKIILLKDELSES